MQVFRSKPAPPATGINPLYRIMQGKKYRILDSICFKSINPLYRIMQDWVTPDIEEIDSKYQFLI